MTTPDAAHRLPQPRLLTPFTGQTLSPPPIWLMRQAGRYLPEYLATRAKAGSFLDLCYSPALAAEVTLQPIRRFGFDGAILFSDILVVPDALGQTVDFVEGEGPRLDPIRSPRGLSNLNIEASAQKFGLVAETVARLRQDLPRDTALIGFCGAPWTVATYMVEGASSPDQRRAREWAYADPAGFGALIDILVDASLDYLDGQARAGADLVQIFDTWAGTLPEDQFEKWVVGPTAKIVEGLKRRHPGLPIIGFPRGIGPKVQRYVSATRVGGIGCDTGMPVAAMANLANDQRCVVQGNLDPLLLLVGGPPMAERTRDIIAALKGVPFIFNLGHGIMPETPPEHVAGLVDLVRASRN